MGSGIAGSNAQESLNTAFMAVGEEVFSKRGDSTYGLGGGWWKCNTKLC